jgi:hypothetical protein
VLKVHTQPIKRPRVGFNKRAKDQPKAPLVWRTGLSGVPLDSVRCAKEERPQELTGFGNLQRLVRYNSPDMSGVHRTVRCNSGATAIRRQRLPATQLMRALRARRRQARPYWRTGQGTVDVRCAPDIQAGPQVRSSNGQNPTAVMTWRGHRTVRCAIEQTASQRPPLVVGAINTPTTPPFIASKFSTSQPLTRARH